jgi:hypothetical protein
MQVKITRQEFKAQARRQHQILVERHVPAKLADVQESLAVSLGYRNLAHLYGIIQSASDTEVPFTRVKNWSRWVMYLAFDENTGNEFWCLLPEGATLDDVASTDTTKASRLLKAGKAFPEGMVLSAETTVLETYVELPSIERYGLTPPADEEKVKDWVVGDLGFRVPKRGVSVSRHDRRDDSAQFVAVTVAVTDKDAALIREKMFFAEAARSKRFYDIQFDATTHTDDKGLLDNSLSDEFIARFNTKAKAEGTFPAGVVELVKGYVSEDDEQGDTDIHCFVGVTLRVEAVDDEAAWAFEPPTDILDEIFTELMGSHDVDYWEILEAYEVSADNP